MVNLRDKPGCQANAYIKRRVYVSKSTTLNNIKYKVTEKECQELYLLVIIYIKTKCFFFTVRMQVCPSLNVI